MFRERSKSVRQFDSFVTRERRRRQIVDLGIFNVKITKAQGIISVAFSVIIILWGSFLRDLPESLSWLESNIDPIIIGAIGTAGMVLLSLLFVVINKSKLNANTGE